MTAAARAALFLFKGDPSYRKKSFASAYYTKITWNVQMEFSEFNYNFRNFLPEINKFSQGSRGRSKEKKKL